MTDLSTRAEQETILKFTRTEDKLRFFIAGLATLRLGAPNGVNPAIHHAKMLRTIRQSAKTLLQETSGEG